MRTIRRAASLLLLLPVLLALTACEAPPTQTASEGEAAPSIHAVLSSVPLGIEPKDPEDFEAAVQGGEWGAVWNQLAWDISEDFDGQVRLWGVLVTDGEQRKSFLTKPVTPEGAGPADVLDLPGSLWPSPGDWSPGTEWVPGTADFLPDGAEGSPLPRVAAFFESNAWLPFPGHLAPGEGSFRPAPDNWLVNGIVDGIYDKGPGATVSGAVQTQILLIPLATEPPTDVQGKWGTAGILIGFKEAS